MRVGLERRRRVFNAAAQANLPTIDGEFARQFVAGQIRAKPADTPLDARCGQNGSRYWPRLGRGGTLARVGQAEPATTTKLGLVPCLKQSVELTPRPALPPHEERCPGGRGAL